MTQENKVTKQLIDTIWKGEIIDSRGRVLKLRNPTMLDEFQLCAVLKEKAEISQCVLMGEMLIKVAAIDNTVMGTPTSFNEFAANLNNLGKEGFNALMEHMQKNMPDESEAKETIKK